MTMEKYGVDQDNRTYRVIQREFGKVDDVRLHGSGLSYDEALKLKEKYPGSEVQPD